MKSIRDLDYHRLDDSEDRRRRRSITLAGVNLLLNILILIFSVLNAVMLWRYLCH